MMCTVVKTMAVAAANGRRLAPSDVNAVGLKDVPLRSLFPDEPRPPAPVSLSRVWSFFPVLTVIRAACTPSHCMCVIVLLEVGGSASHATWFPVVTNTFTCNVVHAFSGSVDCAAIRRAPRSSRWPSWAVAWRGCRPQWSCWTRGEGQGRREGGGERAKR